MLFSEIYIVYKKLLTPIILIFSLAFFVPFEYTFSYPFLFLFI